MLVSADKATKRRKELEDIAENMVIRPTTLVKSHYKKFKIFSGSLKYSLPNFTEKELKKIEFLTQNRTSRVSCVTSIPANNSVNLNTKISWAYFQKYLSLITSDKKRKEYVTLPGITYINLIKKQVGFHQTTQQLPVKQFWKKQEESLQTNTQNVANFSYSQSQLSQQLP